ncbi:MAG: hypothetical protein JW915_01615 [Chitinispirillaceae bacterium]|nr:hypothetical protein [Chitinispirillaceae bacterium]
MNIFIVLLIIISSVFAAIAEETAADSTTAPLDAIVQNDSTSRNLPVAYDSSNSKPEDKQAQATHTKTKLIKSSHVDLEEQIDTEIDALIDKIHELEEKIENLREAKYDSRAQDTIDAEFIINKINEKRILFTEKVTKSRAQGYGGGVIIQPMVLGIRMKPVKNFALKNISLRPYRFSRLEESYRPVLVMGAFAYGGVGNGLRIGFGGWGGDSYYEGERVDGNLDTVMILNLHTSFGGMLVEKVILHKNINFLFGGVIGGGTFSLKRSVQLDNAFNSLNDWEQLDDESNYTEATYAGVEIHSGFTATILPWMHLGMDLNSLFSFSVSGFKGLGSRGFTTVNPGIRVRIVLGNLG